MVLLPSKFIIIHHIFLNTANVEMKLVKVCINESSQWRRNLYYCDNDTEEEESAVQDGLHARPLALSEQLQIV